MKVTDFILYLFWEHKCELKHGGQKIFVKKGAKQSFFNPPFQKNGSVRPEQLKSVCSDLGIPEPKN